MAAKTRMIGYETALLDGARPAAGAALALRDDDLLLICP